MFVPAQILLIVIKWATWSCRAFSVEDGQD